MSLGDRNSGSKISHLIVYLIMFLFISEILRNGFPDCRIDHRTSGLISAVMPW